MKKLISLVLCLGMLMGILSVASFADEKTTTLAEKGATWSYVANELKEGEDPAAAPAGWTTGAGSDTWETGAAPFAGSAWTHSSAVTVFPYGCFDAYLVKKVNVTNAADIQTMMLSVIYDENPVIYINGVEVWSATGFHDSGYITADLSDKTGALKDGENVIAVYFKNAIGGGGSVFDCEIKATSGAATVVDGKAIVRSAVGYNAAGDETKNPFGEIGYEKNLFDGDVNSVWGWGAKDAPGIYVVVDLLGVVNVTEVFLQTKNEGAMANNEEAHGKYKVEALVDGKWTEVGTVDALINGKTLKANVVTNKIKVTITEWTNDNWDSICELAIYANEVDTPAGPNDPVEPPKNGDATVFAVAFAVVAMFGMAVVVTKKVHA